ncbi:substrate-binding domain-containing protein [Actinomadura flavalba]|uniref:substrate-binding domain-containing protein n=1 Tax=Actinomadura flavalba TaxID=1120938 RepID=UPI00035F021D|nr:substrate-binding domain-containing protein [Actinomadura flavalba]
MSGRHRNDFPEGPPGDGQDPVFGPANDGSSDWFAPRDSQSHPVNPPPREPEDETPDWYQPRAQEQPPAYGAGGFTGASDAGGYGLGRSAQGGYGEQEPRRDAPREEDSGGYRLPGASSAGYGGYESVSRSDERPAGFFGGRAGGSGDSGGYGPGASGGYSDDPGRRRKKRRGAMIGPLAGAVGLAVLLGVGVYAFAGTGGGCDGDDALKLTVSAAPDIEPAVVKAAGRYNDARHKVGGKCAQAKVVKAEPGTVATLLSGQGVATGDSARPDVWIPDSSLWTSLVRSSDKGKEAVTTTKTSVATTPIVVGLPRTLAGQLQREGVTATPSWDNLLKAAGGVPGGGVTKNQMIPPGAVRLFLPEPANNATGMGALMVTDALLTNDPNKGPIFTGIVRTVREATVPKVEDQFKYFKKGRTGKQPIALAPEQAVWKYNKSSPGEPAVALYPLEGTLSMDYPVAITTADDAKAKAAALLEQALTSPETRADVQELGFRAPDGKAPAGFSDKLGVSPSRPRQLPSPKAAEVAGVMQSWSKLSLGLRMLVLTDVSGSMAQKVGPNMNRLQAIARVSQGGLSMMSNDTEMGHWLFSTKMQGNVPYKKSISIGPLGERVAGSTTRRYQMLSLLSQMEPKPDGDTALYETAIAAYKEMSRTYKPEFGNSILLLTDGKNDDPGGGPTLRQTLNEIKRLKDPNKPIQINMIGFGDGVDRNELEQIAAATNGSVQIAMTAEEIKKIFLAMLSRRIAE